ncbi:MAG TPA: hypothetical protein VGB08_05960, partial [Allosphingosinicella sp.]
MRQIVSNLFIPAAFAQALPSAYRTGRKALQWQPLRPAGGALKAPGRYLKRPLFPGVPAAMKVTFADQRPQGSYALA